jgi:hypothetical protein
MGNKAVPMAISEQAALANPEQAPVAICQQTGQQARVRPMLRVTEYRISDGGHAHVRG